jgi:hypothetical protein
MHGVGGWEGVEAGPHRWHGGTGQAWRRRGHGEGAGVGVGAALVVGAQRRRPPGGGAEEDGHR